VRTILRVLGVLLAAGASYAFAQKITGIGATFPEPVYTKWFSVYHDSHKGVEINYTTTIVLPRPVKKVDNATAKLSDDKKTVTLKFNLIEVFDHPEQFGYKIEY